MTETPHTEGKSAEEQIRELSDCLTRLSEEVRLLSGRESAAPDRVISVEQSGGRLIRKWASGLMEQWYTVRGTLQGGSSWGEITCDGNIQRVKFEPAFLKPPNLTYSVSSTMRDGFLCVSGEGTRDYSPGYYFCRPVGTGFEGHYTVSFYAVGRWK